MAMSGTRDVSELSGMIRNAGVVAPVALSRIGPYRLGRALVHQAAGLAHVDLIFSEDLEQDLGRAAIFVYVTHSEGLGSAVLMAMAAGVPVIASNAGGLSEIVEHERTGLLVENTPAAIAQAIRRLKQDPSWAGSLARNARLRVEQKFSAGEMVSRTLAVYRTLC